MDDPLGSKQSLTLKQSAIEQITPIEEKVYSFHWESFRLNLAINHAKAMGEVGKMRNAAAINDFLNHSNGIKHYHNIFRIANLGDKESYWLNLQHARTRDSGY